MATIESPTDNQSSQHQSDSAEQLSAFERLLCQKLDSINSEQGTIVTITHGFRNSGFRRRFRLFVPDELSDRQLSEADFRAKQSLPVDLELMEFWPSLQEAYARVGFLLLPFT